MKVLKTVFVLNRYKLKTIDLKFLLGDEAFVCKDSLGGTTLKGQCVPNPLF